MRTVLTRVHSHIQRQMQHALRPHHHPRLVKLVERGLENGGRGVVLVLDGPRVALLLEIGSRNRGVVQNRGEDRANVGRRANNDPRRGRVLSPNGYTTVEVRL